MEILNRLTWLSSWIDLSPESFIQSMKKEFDFTSEELQEITKFFPFYVKSITKDVLISGRIFLRYEITKILRERLRVEDYCKKHPECLEIEINPVFIVGLPRTGSTILCRLLACDERFRPLKYWEANRPAPVNGKTGKAESAREINYLSWIVPDLKAIHLLDNEEPEECVFLQRQFFISWFTAAVFDVPEYTEFLLSEKGQQAVGDSYSYHKKCLQVLSHFNKDQRTWLLKSPFHSYSLETIKKYYPNARFICLHRDREEVYPSFCSLISLSRGLYSKVDNHVIGQQISYLLDLMTEKLQCPVDRLDLQYNEFPLDRIYEFLGITLPTETRTKMDQYLKQNPQNKYGVHKYSAESFGLKFEI